MLFERLALLHEGVANAVELVAELNEPAVMDDTLDNGHCRLIGHEDRRPHPSRRVLFFCMISLTFEIFGHRTLPP